MQFEAGCQFIDKQGRGSNGGCECEVGDCLGLSKPGTGLVDRVKPTLEYTVHKKRKDI